MKLLSKFVIVMVVIWAVILGLFGTVIYIANTDSGVVFSNEQTQEINNSFAWTLLML